MSACTTMIVTGSFHRVPNAAVEYAYINQEADFSQYTMSDSMSGQVLARAGDKSSDISVEYDDDTWDDVQRAAEYRAGLFRNWLDNSLGKRN